MDQAISAFQYALGKTFGAALGSAIIFAAVFVLVLLLVAPIYWILKRRGSGTIDFRLEQSPGDTLQWHDEPALSQDAGTAGDGSSARSAGESERRERLRRLASVERVVATVYQYMLYLAIAGMTGLAAFFYIALPDDGNRDFLLLYIGVVYLIGMLWATGQTFSVRRRLHPKSDPDDVLSQLRSKINITVETSPQVQFVDDAALDRAQRHLDGGGTLDEACAVMDSRYLAMNGIMKGVFKKAVETALEQRRKPRA